MHDSWRNATHLKSITDCGITKINILEMSYMTFILCMEDVNDEINIKSRILHKIFNNSA